MYIYIYRYTYIFNFSQILLSTEINPCKPILHEENKEIKEVKFDLQQVFYLPDDTESDIHDIPPVGSLEFYFPPWKQTKNKTILIQQIFHCNIFSKLKSHEHRES